MFTKVKKICEKLNIHLKKFSQNKEVRNLNIKHNRDYFLNMKIIEVLINDEILSQEEAKIILNMNCSYNNESSLYEILNMKVKNYYQFHFLKSSYFKNWLRDPIKISSYKFYKSNTDKVVEKPRKKSLNMSKNIFRTQPEDYEKYKKLLLHTSCNFIFYFQNNPLKFGKKKYAFFSTKN